MNGLREQSRNPLFFAGGAFGGLSPRDPHAPSFVLLPQRRQTLVPAAAVLLDLLQSATPGAAAGGRLQWLLSGAWPNRQSRPQAAVVEGQLSGRPGRTGTSVGEAKGLLLAKTNEVRWAGRGRRVRNGFARRSSCVAISHRRTGPGPVCSGSRRPAMASARTVVAPSASGRAPSMAGSARSKANSPPARAVAGHPGSALAAVAARGGADTARHRSKATRQVFMRPSICA